MSVLRVNSITGKDDDRSSGFPLDFTGNLATFAEVSTLPGSPVSGTVVNHSGTLKFYNGTRWALVSGLTNATGGTVTSYISGSTTYLVHTFLSSAAMIAETS